MFKSLLFVTIIVLTSYNAMAGCTPIGEGGGGGSICCEVKNGVIECSDSLG